MPEPLMLDVYVKVVLITRDDSILTVFNDKWGAFTLPMSGTRTWPDADDPLKIIKEEPHVTATRAAVEALGRPLRLDELANPRPDYSLGSYNQSGRDGNWKIYHIDVFRLEIDPGEIPRPIGGMPVAWMTLGQMRNFKPISDTATYVASKIKEE